MDATAHEPPINQTTAAKPLPTICPEAQCLLDEAEAKLGELASSLPEPDRSQVVGAGVIGLCILRAFLAQSAANVEARKVKFERVGPAPLVL